MTTQSSKNTLKSYYQANPWKSRLILVILTLVILLTIVRIALTPTIIYGATNWLKEQGIDSTIEDIEFNFISGSISLIDASGYHDDKLLFNIDLVELHWRWAPLSDKSVVVTKVELDNLNVNIDQYSDEIVIGGLTIPQGSSSEPAQKEPTNEADEEIKPWSATLGEVVFTNLHVCYMQDTGTHAAATEDTRFIDYCVYLDEMSWGGTISYGNDPELLKTDDLALSSTGDFELDGLTVMDNKLGKQLLRSSSNTLNNVSLSGLNNIHFDSLEMNGLSALQRDDEDHQDAVRFTHLVINDINFSNLNSLKIDSLEVDNTGLYIVKHGQDEWEYAQWIPRSSTTPTPESSDKNEKTEPSQFEFAINDILISDSDFCYLETESKLYYCFSQNDLDWKGSIVTSSKADDTKIAVSGDLTATNTKIHNPELNRDLLDIKLISLSKLNVTDIDKASFEAFTIDSFSALQRSKESGDSTASFSTLAVKEVNYASNNITIDTIELTGLSSLVSKNKDESWEHDKWFSNKSEAKPEAESETKKPDGNSEPLLIAINSATIKTKKDLFFVDNSTKPAMEVGLTKLDFNIKNLNPGKPKADSPFKFSGKTKRHSTIDLAGTVKPYAEKVSFDAKGKLKGFDLRAATPATKKSIGHIIKSGQLDADLEILAKDGILDSNVGLSLYQFHIKPTSKEDAAKLDKELGMPLNQTLVLLRDKDDSIHLDIPITGDVNNPDFNPMDAILKATTKAATVTLITFYTPYGLIYAGGNVLFDLATAMNFDPVAFDAGSAKLPADGEKQLANLGKLLTEKPQVHLSLCGMTNKEDVYVLYPALKKSVEKDKKADAPGLSKEQILALKKLATDRQIASKNYLIKELSITHDRLILCEPEYQTDGEAFSGVEINI